MGRLQNAERQVNCDARNPYGPHSIIEEFASNTSAHGIPGIARSKTVVNRIFWTVSFLVFTGIMIFFIIGTITDYFKYPTLTTVSFAMERSQKFPAVTVCNYSPVQYDRLVDYLLNYTAAKNHTLPRNPDLLTTSDLVAIKDFFTDQVNAGEAVEKFYFTLESMMMYCDYNGESCNRTDFISFISLTHGLCYTFNSHRKNTSDTKLRYTDDRGGTGKLKLRFYAHSHQYFPILSADVSAGFVAMLHDSDEPPSVEIGGIELAPGRKHKLAYRKRTSQFLPAPYTNCTTQINPAMQAVFDQYGGAGYSYSQRVCQMTCSQTFVFQHCDCVSPTYWLARLVYSRDSKFPIEAKLCTLDNLCMVEAQKNLSSSQTLWNEYCGHCTEACLIVDYLVTVSSVAAPKLLYAKLTKPFVEASGVPLPANWSTNWITEIERNYVSVEVMCQTSIIETLNQEPTMNGITVLSNIGGHSGLWIGISLLSIMEFIEMFFRLGRYGIRLIRRKILYE